MTYPMADITLVSDRNNGEWRESGGVSHLPQKGRWCFYSRLSIKLVPTQSMDARRCLKAMPFGDANRLAVLQSQLIGTAYQSPQFRMTTGRPHINNAPSERVPSC